MSPVTRGDVFERIAEHVIVPCLRERLAALNLPVDLAEHIVNADTIRPFFPRSGDKREAADEFMDFCERLFQKSAHVYWWPWSEAWAA